MSIIESLKKLVDPSGAREDAAERISLRELPVRENTGPPPSFACRVCGHLGPEPAFCPRCLAQTMRPAPAARSPEPVVASPEPAVASPEPSLIEVPIDGTLDLHTYAPSEVESLVPAYLAACLEAGIRDVRIVHGKGTGTLRRTVHALLARDPRVDSHRPADEGAGGWGATLVRLKG